MAIKVENRSSSKLPKNVESFVRNVVKTLPSEHSVGLDRIAFVDEVRPPMPAGHKLSQEIPGFYYPKAAMKSAYIELSARQLTGTGQPFHKRAFVRLSFKSNLAMLVFSLVGQHYFTTMRHSVRRGQMEGLVRGYVEKHMKKWNENEHRLRARLFKPLEPTLTRWAKKLNKTAAKASAGQR